MLWAEGPAWNAVGRYLVWSDIPNDVQLRWLDEDGHVSVLRRPAGNSNGNTLRLRGPPDLAASTATGAWCATSTTAA